MQRSLKKLIIPLISWGVLSGLIFVIFSNENLKASLVDSFQLLTIKEAIAIGSVAILMQGVISLRLAIIIAANEHSSRYRLKENIKVQFVSLFVGFAAIVPGFSDVAKAAIVKSAFSMTVARAVKIIAFERMVAAFSFIALATIAVPAILFIFPKHELLFTFIPLLLLVGVFFALIALRFVGKTRQHTIVEQVTSAVLRLTALVGQKKHLIELSLVAIFQILIVAFEFKLISYSIDLDISFAYLLVFTPSILFISSLPIFYQGWGGRELAFVFTLGNYANIPASELISLSAIFGTFIFVSGLPGLVFWLFKPRFLSGRDA